MALRKYIILYFINLAFCYAQPKIVVVPQNIFINERHYLVFDIIYSNTSSDTIVTYLQNWRAISIDKSTKSIFGFPAVPRLTNRLFFVETGIEFKTLVGRIEDNFFGKIVSNSFALIRPKDSLKFVIIIDDSSFITKYNQKQMDMYLLLNWSSYRLFKKIIPGNILDSICLSGKTVIIPRMEVDVGNKWNSVMFQTSSVGKEILKINLANEEEIITELTKIFQTFLFHNTLGN